MTMQSPFLVLSEVAEYTRAPISSVRHWIATRKLVSVRIGRRRLVRLSDLEAFVASTAQEPGEPKLPSTK
jgi:excisionase family DNA binding protein